MTRGVVYAFLAKQLFREYGWNIGPKDVQLQRL